MKHRDSITASNLTNRTLSLGLNTSSGPILKPGASIELLGFSPRDTILQNTTIMGLVKDGSIALTMAHDTLSFPTNAIDAPNTAPSNLAPGTISFYLDEAGNNLKVLVKYSNGTVKTGTVALS